MKRGRRKKGQQSKGQLAIDEFDGHLEYYRNIKSGLLFVGLDDDYLVNPAGKIVELRPEFYDKITSEFWELSQQQRAAIFRHFG